MGGYIIIGPFCMAGGEGFNWDALDVSMKSYTLVEKYGNMGFEICHVHVRWS
jgi:hypothetical protein